MKQFVIDFSKAGFKKGALHLIKGIVLYGAIGVMGYLTTRYTAWNPGTFTEIAIYTGIGEGLQAASKWLTTTETSFETPEPIVYPDGSQA